jgi:hypothetical protein
MDKVARLEKKIDKMERSLLDQIELLTEVQMAVEHYVTDPLFIADMKETMDGITKARDYYRKHYHSERVIKLKYPDYKTR